MAVTFTEKSAERIAKVVKQVEGTPVGEATQQRRRAGGYRMESLFEVTAVQTSPKTVTLKRVQDTDDNLNDRSETLEVAYDPDNQPAVGAQGLIIRLGDGTRLFFPGGSGTETVLVKIGSKVDTLTYNAETYEEGPGGSPTESVTVKVMQIATGETIPSGTFLPAYSQLWTDTVFLTVNVARDY